MLIKKSLLKLIFMNTILGFLVFFLLGAQFEKIGFHSDDYGIIHHGSWKNTTDIKRILKNGDIMHSACFSEENLYPYGRPSCLEVIYRPLLLIIMGTEKKIFGVNPYATHLVHIGFHTITTLAIFNALLFFTTPMLAALCSSFFAFHSSLKDYFFWQCYIQNSFESFLLILLLFFSFLFYRSSKIRWLFPVALTFFTSLLLRETLIVFPLLITLFWFFLRPQGRHLFDKKFLIPILTTQSWIIGLYTLLRCWAYPLSTHLNRIGIKELTNESWNVWAKNKFYDLLTYWFDLMGVKWIPCGNLVIKLSIIGIISALFFYAWRSQKSKNLTLVLLGSITMLSWPSIAFFHSSRYLYLPTIALALLIGILAAPAVKKTSPTLRIIFFIIFGSYVTLQACISFKNISLWADYTYKEMLFLQNLAPYSQIPNKKIIVIGMPRGFLGTGGCKGPAVVNSGENCIYHQVFSPRTVVWNGTPIPKLLAGILNPEKLHIQSLTYELRGNTLRIQTQNPETLWFQEKDIEISLISQKIEILERAGAKINAFKIHLNRAEIKDVILLLWQHEKGTFQEIVV